MAERRMFAKSIIDSDAFIDMPVTARLLYYDLGMRADDDGFVNSPKKIMRMIGASEDDLRILVLRKFIIPFDSGVVVIKHWRIHNYIRKDTYNETLCIEEKALLESNDETKVYSLKDGTDLDVVDIAVDGSLTQDRLGKVRIGKDSIGKVNNMVIDDDRALPKKTSFDEEFDEVWSQYPRKQGKQNALKAYVKARKSGVSKEDIVSGLDRYINYIRKENIDDKYVKQGSTWFNQHSWEDDYTSSHRSFLDELENIKQDDPTDWGLGF